MLEKVIQIAREAGEVIMKFYENGDRNLQYKKDNSPLTQADTSSDQFIRNALLKNFEFPVLSEETETPYEIRKNWRSFWLVDPLDGSKEFVTRDPEFTVNVALIQAGEPILGVIFAPALRDLFFAEKGNGAYWMRKGEMVSLPCKQARETVMATSRFHESEAMRQFAKINSIRHVKTIGSSLKFAHLAMGDVSVYPRYAGSSEWDIGAGHIILKEAGGQIISLPTKKEPKYNKPDLKNHFFIALSRHSLLRDFHLVSE